MFFTFFGFFKAINKGAWDGNLSRVCHKTLLAFRFRDGIKAKKQGIGDDD